MKILCKKRYDQAVAYAKEIGDTTLQSCLDKLQRWEDNKRSEGYEMELSQDFAPYSMLFTLRKSDGTTHISGGLIFHGNPDKSCSITSDQTIGWKTHT